MNSKGKETNRRQWLRRATGFLGTFGLAAGSVPFVRSMSPSARAVAQGGSVVADISAMKPGEQISLVWRKKPIWILRRNDNMLSELESTAHLSLLRDPASAVATQQPDYAQNAYRSIRPEYLVAIGICTHLGCVPRLHDENDLSIDKNWIGGYFCPCHGSKFDFAGRVYKNVPAPTNLVIPPYYYESDSIINIGSDLVL